MDEKCGTCKFFKVNNMLRTCNYDPPKAEMVQLRDGWEMEKRSFWPDTQDGGWCGKWEMEYDEGRRI